VRVVCGMVGKRGGVYRAMATKHPIQAKWDHWNLTHPGMLAEWLQSPAMRGRDYSQPGYWRGLGAKIASCTGVPLDEVMAWLRTTPYIVDGV
jgi:hypothetical protein